jgi:hypothetical protein
MKENITFSALIVEVDGKYVRLDGFIDDPLNTRRRINISKLCKNILEAKNFSLFQEDLPVTFKAFPTARLLCYMFTLTIDARLQI